LEHIDRYVQESLKPDYWWIDAGWYPNKGRDWQELLGTWEVDTKRFPRGLRGVFDVAHAKGIRSIVWFEPERVQPDSWLYRNHPEWLLGPDGSTKLFNHGNSEAHAWLVDHIDRLITEQGIDLYRQDFACFARDLWDAADAPDRKGITENRYVVGYLRYLDELRRRHPEMLIDICAAGGKRLDLENLRRAVPLWRSDYTFEPIGTQSQTYGLAFWLPYFGTGTAADTTYVLRSNMCPATVGTWDMRRKDLNYGALRTWLSQWRQVAPDYYGDFYPLTPYRRDKDVWMAWQFDRPEAGTGMIQVFRREESPFVSARFRLRALTPDARYAVTDLDTGTTQKFLGRELIEKGLLVAIADCPGSALVKYTKSDP
jgi:alpha-galactosidase